MYIILLKSQHSQEHFQYFKPNFFLEDVALNGHQTYIKYQWSEK